MRLRCWTGLAVAVALTTTGNGQLTEVLPSKRTVKTTTTRYDFDARVFPTDRVTSSSTSGKNTTKSSASISDDDVQLKLPPKVGVPVQIDARVYELDPAIPVKTVTEAMKQVNGKTAKLIATPSLVTGSGNLATYETVYNLTHPVAYDPPTVPKSMADQITPAKLKTNSGDDVMPAFPAKFSTRDVGLKMNFRPIVNANGSITLRWDLENSTLRGFSKNGETITIEKKKPVGRKTKTVTLAENSQYKAEFLDQKIKRVSEIRKGSNGVESLIDPVTATKSEPPVLHGAFATNLTAEGLPPLLVIVNAKKIPEPPAEKEAGQGIEKQIFVTIRAIEMTQEAAQALGSSETPLFPMSILTDPQFQVAIRALNQKKGVDLLTAPSVMMRESQQAKVEVAREFIYPTEYDPPEIQVAKTGNVDAEKEAETYFPVTPATPVKFKTRNTGVQFLIKGRLAENNLIELKLRPETTEFVEFFNFGEPIHTWAKNGLGKDIPIVITENRIEMPVFKTRRIETTVRIPDGSTICLGGLITEETQDVQDKIPVLGDLPLVGKAFRSDVELHLQKKVYFFMTARLMDPAGVPITNKTTGKKDSAPEKKKP